MWYALEGQWFLKSNMALGPQSQRKAEDLSFSYFARAIPTPHAPCFCMKFCSVSIHKFVSPSHFELFLSLEAVPWPGSACAAAGASASGVPRCRIHREAGRPSAENPEVIKEKEKPDLGKEKSMGQFAPGAANQLSMS